MAIRRGTLYRVSGLTRAHGLLVITNDEWNEAPTQDLSGALVYTEPGPGRTPIPGAELHSGPLMSVPKVDLLEPLVEFSAEQMKPVGEAISEILGLDDLRADPPRAPAAQPGPIDYPRWSSIYYAGPRVGALSERKRYLVISHDQYNRAVGGAICIRTTTSERRGGPTIPTLSDKVTKAVCVLPTFWSTHSVGIRETRPQPAQLFLPDMSTVAAGMREALDLPSIVVEFPGRPAAIPADRKGYLPSETSQTT